MYPQSSEPGTESSLAAGVSSPYRLTAWSALWLVLGYVIAQSTGFVFVNLGWRLAGGHHATLRPPAGIQTLAWSAALGMLLGAVWVVVFAWYYARPWLQQTDSRGVAWTPPSRPHAYLVAMLLAITLVALVGGVEQLLPPDPDKLTGPMQQLSASHGMAHLIFVLMAVAIAPLLEEFIFRGVAFAAVAHSFGTVTAVITTTLAFVALHSADKIHYWPGFVLVGCLALTASFLRLRYRSLWPGILLHACYNGFLILLS